MALHQLKQKQFLPITIDEAWDFFSSPNNLKTITPDYLSFEILSDPEPKAYAGQLIRYTVKPILGIPLHWLTEITYVDAPHFFVDEQRFGPYAFWHHKHHFTPVEGGVEMIDVVDYKLPLAFLGDIVHSLFVKRQLQGIFQYRKKKLIELFGTKQ